MDDCIEWTKSRFANGYGRQYRFNRELYAHRLAYESVNGPIPDGMSVLHKCDNPPCVNPEHLYLGTHNDNMRDKSARNRQAKGNNNGRSKLTEETATYSMARLLIGETQESVAVSFGVSQTSISMLWRGRTWKHLFPTS